MASPGAGLRRLEIDASPRCLAATIGSWDRPALLEGGLGFGVAGRWSFYAAEPRLVFEARGDRWTLAGPGIDRSGLDPLGSLAAIHREWGALPGGSSPDDPPFPGGWIGFLGYDLAPRLERIARKAPADSRLPDIRLALYDTFAAVDHLRGTATLHAADLLGDGANSQERRLRDWDDRLREQGAARMEPGRLGTVVGRSTREEYLASVRRALDYIAAGDIFQVNLSQRFEARGRFDPLDLYLRLRAGSPAPYSAFLRWDDLAVASASPELFYEVRGDRIVTRPIKGTRPRGLDPEQDARLAAELRASPKDRAELTMIVDLERNDLGRVCRYGTVQVTEPLVVESYAQVHHLVATVEGRLRPDAGPVDVIRAVFPGGSITGAPKVRAMQIIDELEPTRRGLYTGALGFITPGGDATFNIAIRTLLIEGDRVSYQVGGGIVADSDPEAEYEETLDKGRGLREVLEGRGLDA